MFSKVRTSLKAGSKGRRRSIKAKYQQRGGAFLVAFPSKSPDTTDEGTGIVTKDDKVEERKVQWTKVLPKDLKPFLDGITVTNFISFIENQDILLNAATQAIYGDFKIEYKEASETTDEAEEKRLQDQILEKINAIKEDLDPIFQKSYNYLFDVVRVVAIGEIGGVKNATKIEQIEGKDEQFTEFVLNLSRAKNLFIEMLAYIIQMQKKDPTILELIRGQAEGIKREGAINIRAMTYAADAEVNALRSTGMLLRDGFYLMQPTADVEKMITLRNNPDKTQGFWCKFVTKCLTPPDAAATKAQVLKKILDVETFSMLAAYIFGKYKAAADTAGLKKAIFEDLRNDAGTSFDDANHAKLIPDTPEQVPVAEGIMLDAVLKGMRMEHVHFIVHLVATMVGATPPAAPVAAAVAAPGSASAAGPIVDKIAAAIAAATVEVQTAEAGLAALPTPTPISDTSPPVEKAAGEAAQKAKADAEALVATKKAALENLNKFKAEYDEYATDTSKTVDAIVTEKLAAAEAAVTSTAAAEKEATAKHTAAVAAAGGGSGADPTSAKTAKENAEGAAQKATEAVAKLKRFQARLAEFTGAAASGGSEGETAAASHIAELAAGAAAAAAAANILPPVVKEKYSTIANIEDTIATILNDATLTSEQKANKLFDTITKQPGGPTGPSAVVRQNQMRIALTTINDEDMFNTFKDKVTEYFIRGRKSKLTMQNFNGEAFTKLKVGKVKIENGKLVSTDVVPSAVAAASSSATAAAASTTAAGGAANAAAAEQAALLTKLVDKLGNNTSNPSNAARKDFVKEKIKDLTLEQLKKLDADTNDSSFLTSITGEGVPDSTVLDQKIAAAKA